MRSYGRRSLTLRETAAFFDALLRHVSRTRRAQEVEHSLRRLENLEAMKARRSETSRHVTIDEYSTCRLCGKSIGERTAFVYNPQTGEFFHHFCYFAEKKH